MVQSERSMVSTIRNIQKNWISHIRTGCSLIKITLEGRIEGEKEADRPRLMLWDWVFDTKNMWNYQNVKELAQYKDAWQRWSSGPA